MATQGALNEKPQYCCLNSNKIDSSNENGMEIKMADMAERSEERHGNPSSENNSGDTAMAATRENSKIKIKASKAKQNDDLVAR